jgi:hypothetical protein
MTDAEMKAFAKMTTWQRRAWLKANDWTYNPQSGRTNDSAEFKRLVGEINRMRGMDGRFILAQLAHCHGLIPKSKKRH